MSLADLAGRATLARTETRRLNEELAKTTGLAGVAQAPSGGGVAPSGGRIDPEAFGELIDLVRGIDGKVTQSGGAAVTARRFEG